MGADNTSNPVFSELQKAKSQGQSVGLTGIRPSSSPSAPAAVTPSAPAQQYAAQRAQEDVMRRRQQEEQMRRQQESIMRRRQQEEQMRRRSSFFRWLWVLNKTFDLQVMLDAVN